MATSKKLALITGGSRGLGKNMALHLASRGIDIIITYHSNKDAALSVIKEIQEKGQKAAALKLDTGDVKSFDSFYKQLAELLPATFNTSRFDFLINNAGIGIHAAFAETTEEQFDELVNIHFKGPYFLTQKALSFINDGGSIVNISTGLARFSLPGYSAYASMKGAMEVLTKYQAKELGSRKISVNIVAPGAIETDFSGGFVRDTPQVNKYIAESTALGRVGLPDDIGGVVAFLCTLEAKWINAQRIEVSGGMNL